MHQDFQCTKIKDGLYLGNIVAAHDYEFLVSNKFGYVVNCTAEVPNVFEHENVKYLKFKLIENKPHKLWDETLKKLNKLQKFLEQAQETSLCCLVHSFHGENRSLVFITGYLMKKKCLQFLKSKQIFIGLSNHYISQLQILEEILSKEGVLSSAWTPPYINEEEEIISKTYLNSLEGKEIKPEPISSNQQQQVQPKKKNQRRIVWLDKLQKKKRKQQISLKKPDQPSKPKSKPQAPIQTLKYTLPEYDLRNQHILKNIQIPANKRLHSSESLKPKDKPHTNNIVVLEDANEDAEEQQRQPEKNIYQLTINNFISPNFNIINKTEPMGKKGKKKDDDKSRKEDNSKKDQKSQTVKEKEKKQRPTSGNKKSTQKINRAQSEKQVTTVKGLKQVAEFQNIQQPKQAKEKDQKQKKALGIKERDIKKQLKKQLQKVQKQKSSHSSLHLLHPLSTLAQQLIKTQQQATGKRSSTPTRKERKKQVAR